MELRRAFRCWDGQTATRRCSSSLSCYCPHVEHDSIQPGHGDGAACAGGANRRANPRRRRQCDRSCARDRGDAGRGLSAHDWPRRRRFLVDRRARPRAADDRWCGPRRRPRERFLLSGAWPQRGALAANTVAGAVSAWAAAWAISRQWGGRLPLAGIFAEAMALAEQGTIVTGGHADAALRFLAALLP